MSDSLSPPVARLLRERRGLLWICQPHDLKPGESPHGFELPAVEAGLRYREAPEELDRDLAAFFWEAVWLEGAASPVLDALREVADQQPSDSRRSIVVLASEADAGAHVSSQRFLPVYIMPGLIREDCAPDARYGVSRGRVRERIAWDLRSQVEHFPRRALVVVGAQSETDLEPLYEVLEDRPVIDAHVVVVWPAALPTPRAPDNAALSFHVFQGTTAQLTKALAACETPSAAELPRWAIRVGEAVIEIPSTVADRITRRFALITERDLAVPDEFTTDDLEEFLGGTVGSWKAFALGLPIERSYQSEAGRSLTDEVFHLLQNELVAGHKLTHTLRLPCVGGSGGTTLLRTAAFHAAREGYPSLILRPEATEIDVEELLAYTSAVSEACLQRGMDAVPPSVIVLDVEHSRAGSTQQVAQALVAHARRALILEGREHDPQEDREVRGRYATRLRHLSSSVDDEEVRRCSDAFRELASSWNLPLDVPGADQWMSYQAKSSYHDPTGEGPPPTLFWVALRYFLTEGADVGSADRLRDALGGWLDRRTRPLEDSPFLNVVTLTAVLSSFRIAGPLWTILRPVTGGSFSSDLVAILRELRDIISWGERSEDLGDYVIRFAHPALAEEYLRRRGVRSASDRVDCLSQLLSALSPGKAADMWVAESLSAYAFAPAYEHRHYTDWDWRLRAFQGIAPSVASQSKTVLHHWARCLYLSASAGPAIGISVDDQRQRFGLAIQKLRIAIELPRRPGRGEHPSHLHNTLGTALARYANWIERNGYDPGEASAVWQEACGAFEQAIQLMPGANVEALIAFGHRLLVHVRDHLDTGRQLTEGDVEDLARALSLLDEAEQALDDYSRDSIDLAGALRGDRVDALRLLDSQQARGYVEQLKVSDNPDLGYYCEARLIRDAAEPEGGMDAAIGCLQAALDQDRRLGSRSLGFLLLLMRQHSRLQFEFEKALHLHQRLEQIADYSTRPLDAFRHAVLCYQTGRYDEGRARFQQLRAQARRAESPPPRARDMMRDRQNPTNALVTHIRLTQYVTEWRAEGHVEEIGQTVPVRPRHFSPPLRQGDVQECVIRFEFNGPLAVPRRFVESTPKPAQRVNRADG
ncbi:MAG: tetratricopeptide repeat protein [Armatimonadetes bacterium]|nr:tetratricopeptide repeat protein [Armatimonadota bacterium]